MSASNPVTVAFNGISGILTIAGNAQDNLVRYWTGANDSIELEIDGQRYSSERHSPFFSESLKDVNSHTLRHIQLDGGAGIDTLAVADQTLSGTLTIQGDEVVDVEGDVTTAGTLAITADEIAVDGSLSAQEITLKSSESTEVTGTLTALAGDIGGTIQVLGDRVSLLGATIDASGANGGGTILIGGDYQGQGAIPTAAFTQVDAATIIAADALTDGNGGQVIVWADDTTHFSGQLSAQGGTSSGDGGFAEISAKHLAFDGQVNVLAANGTTGTVLFDPIDIVIANADGTDGANGGTVLLANSPAAEPWNVTPAQLNAVGGNVILQASNDITVTDAITLATNGAALTLEAGNEILLNANVTTANGAQLYDGAVVLGTDATLDAGSGDVTFNSIIDGSQSLAVNSSGTTTFNGKIGDTVTQLVDLTTDAVGNTVLNAAGNSNAAGSRAISLTGNAIFNDAVTLTAQTSVVAGGDITFNSTLDGTKAMIFQVGSGRTLTFGENVGSSAVIGATQVVNRGTTLIKSDSFTSRFLRLTNDITIDSPSNTVTITADQAVRFGDLGGSTIRSATDGEDSLVINSTAQIDFGSATDSSQRLNALTLNSDTDNSGGETLNIDGSTITTAGTQTYEDAVVLQSNTAFTSGGNITFNSTVQGETSARNLTVDAGYATLDFNDAVGGSGLINEIDLTAGLVSVDGAIAAQGNITATTDAIAINQAITGTGDLTIVPQTASNTVGLGNGSTGTLNLDAIELANLTDGFSRVLIGDNTSGAVDVVSASFTDPLTLAGSPISDSSSGNDITGDTTFSGNVEPAGSAAVGQLLVNGNVTFASGAALNLQLNGSGTAGTDYDQLQTIGTVNLSNASLNLGLGYTPAVGDILTIVDNDGSDAIAGTFGGLAEGSTITVDGFSFQLSYLGGDGNDVALTVTNSATTIGGTVSGQAVNDNASLSPFASVTLDDANGDNISVSVALDDANKGVFTAASLSAAGFVDAGGTYTLASTTTAVAQTAIRQLVFDPTDNRVAPTLTETSTFTINVNDGTDTTSDGSTTVVSTSINDAPVLTIPAGIAVNEDGINNTIAGIAIADADGDAQTINIGVTNGTLSLNGDGGLAFTIGDGTDDPSLAFSGSLADVNTALNNLTFTPNPDFDGTATVQLQTADTPGDSDTETLSITVNNAPEVTSIALGDTSPTNATSVTFDVTFSESVTGVDTTDFALVTTNTAAATIASVSGSGTSYTVTANGLTGDGSLGLNLVDNDSIVNGNGVTLGGVGTSGNGDGSLTGDTYTIDTTAPSAPSTPVLAPTSDTGSSNADNITSSNTPALTGTAEANSTVTVTSDVDGVIGSAIANSMGAWAIVAPTLTEGNHSITATATDSFNNVSAASGALAITVDTAVPTVAITTAASALTNASPIPITITFSEVMTDFVVGDITVGNGTATNLTTSDNQTFTVDIIPSSDGTVTVDVGANVATDTAGNNNTAATTLSRTFDATVPTVTLTSAAADPINATFSVTATFSEATTDFIETDISVANGTVSNFSGSGTTYTFDVTPTTDGAVDVDVAASVATDAAGNNNAAATTLSRTFDATAPTVLLTSAAADPINATFSVTATFSEATTDFTDTDISVTNGTVSNFSGSGTTYTFDVTPTTDGAVDVDVAASVATDAAGNNNIAATTLSRTLDATAPTVTLTSAAADPINATFSVTATFSEATTDFIETDISVANGTVSNFNGSGTTYTFDVTPTTDGAVDVDVAASVATDAAGNNNIAATTLSRTFDATAPTVTLTSAAADPINANFSVTATFSEATTDFIETDISVTNGTVSNFSGSGTTYIFDVIPTTDGAVDVDVAASVATDAASNNNAAATTLSRTFDATAPTVTLTSAAADPTNSTFSVTATFSEATTDFTDTDISVANGTVSNFSGSGTTYTFDVTPTTDGAVDVDVAASVATDAAGNNNAAATTLSRTFDATAPTVTLTSTAAEPINATFSVTATFSEATTDFTDTDISVTNGTVSNFSGSGTTYTFDVTPTSDGAVDVDVAANVATDAAGNNNAAATTLSRTFDGTAPTVTSITPNLISIIDSNVGTETFTLTVDFSEAMDTSIDPILSFPVEDPSNTLALNTGSWSDSDTYIATYDVADANETVSNIDVRVISAQDTAGNLQTTATQVDGFSISTISSIEFAAADFTSDESIGTSNAVTLTRTGDTSTTSSVQVTITGGTAADTDYTSSSFPLTVTFAPNETTQSVAIPITDDLLSEEDETILLSLIGANNANIGPQATATLTITDNDTAGFNLSKTSATVSEAGTTDIFNITLTTEPLSDVVLTVASDNTDEATVEPASVILNSTNWDTGVDVTVTGVDDTAVDGDQTTTLTISVDAANSDDNFDSVSDQTLNVTTTDDDIATGLLTPFADANSLEVTSLGTDNSVRLEVEQVGVDSLGEIRIFSTDAVGSSRTQIGSFSLLEGGTLPDAYGPNFTVGAIAPGDLLQFELIDNGQTLVATPTSINDGRATLDFGEGTQLAISLFDETSTTNLLNDDASTIDLTGLTGATVNVEFSVYREAKRNNTVKFYTTDSADGGIVIDPLLGTELRPGDSGYKEAALARQLEVELTGENNRVSNFTAAITGGQFLSSFLIIDSGDATAGEILFSHAGANDNNNHVQLLGDNVFGFEDIVGLGDQDFNDVVVEFAVV